MIKIMAADKRTERKLLAVLVKIVMGLEKDEMHPICIEERTGTEIIHVTWPSMPAQDTLDQANDAISMFFATKPQHFGELICD